MDDYASLRLSLKSHLLVYYVMFSQGFYKPISSFNDLNDGERKCGWFGAGKRRPSTAKGILFTIEMIQVLQILLFGLVNLSVLNAPL